MCTKTIGTTTFDFIVQSDNLSWCWIFLIYLHNNIDNVSWEYVNQFEINLIKKCLKKLYLVLLLFEGHVKKLEIFENEKKLEFKNIILNIIV